MLLSLPISISFAVHVVGGFTAVLIPGLLLTARVRCFTARVCSLLGSLGAFRVRAR